MEKRRITWVCLFLANSLGGYGRIVDINLEKLAEICTRYEKYFNSIMVEYTYTAPEPSEEHLEDWKRGELLLFTGPQTILFTAEKPFDKKFRFIQALRFDTLQGLKDVYGCRTYNGRVFREYYIEDPNEPPRGTLQKDPHEDPMTMINNTPLGYTIFHRCDFSLSVLDLLNLYRKNHDPNLLFSLDPAVTKVNGFDAIELSCSVKWPTGKMQKMFGMYFSLEHNYAAVRIIYYNGDKVILEYNVMKLTPIGDEFWFPIECTVLYSDGTSSRITVTDVRVNQPIEEQEYELEFPPGTKVNDTITGKQYTIKPTQEQIDQALYRK